MAHAGGRRLLGSGGSRCPPLLGWSPLCRAVTPGTTPSSSVNRVKALGSSQLLGVLHF